MRKASIKDLSAEAFGPYGTFGKMTDPQTARIGSEPVEFYRDILRLDLGGKSIVSFSTCRVRKRPAVVDVAEYHSCCGEGILPLDGDALIHVGIATPTDQIPLDSFKIFHVPAGTMVALHPGVWHHGPFAYGCDTVNVLIVLPERTYANDCVVYQIDPDDQIRIDGL